VSPTRPIRTTNCDASTDTRRPSSPERMRPTTSVHSVVPLTSTSSLSNCAMPLARSSRTIDLSSLTVTNVTDFGPASPISRPWGMPGITTVLRPATTLRIATSTSWPSSRMAVARSPKPKSSRRCLISGAGWRHRYLGMAAVGWPKCLPMAISSRGIFSWRLFGSRTKAVFFLPLAAQLRIGKRMPTFNRSVTSWQAFRPLLPKSIATQCTRRA